MYVFQMSSNQKANIHIRRKREREKEGDGPAGRLSLS
jgi:hypothetical protein